MSQLAEQNMLHVGKQQNTGIDYNCNEIGMNPSPQKKAYFGQCSNSDSQFLSIEES